MLTSTGCGGHPDAHQVLQGENAGQEAAVLGPHLGDGFPPAAVQDADQPAGVDHGVEVHPLADDIH